MKRSKSIRLVLIGTVAASAVTGCGPTDPTKASLSASEVYTNNFYVQGVGYYHAPFRAWYPLPYNHFDAKSQQYFYGGQWSSQPLQNITNISSPTENVASIAQSQRSDVVRRSGFGSTSRSGFNSWS